MAKNTDLDYGGLDIIVNSVKVGATAPGQAGSTLSGTELGFLDGVTAGTAAASKALVLNSSSGITTGLTLLTATTVTATTLNAPTQNAGSSGSAGTMNVFPSTASKGKLVISAADSAGDTATTIVNASQSGVRTYTIPDAGASASFVLSTGTSTGVAVTSTEFGVLASATNANAGTGKAVILGTSGAVTLASTVTMSAGATVGTTLAVTGVTTPTGGVAAAGGYSVSPRNMHTGNSPPAVSTDFTDYTVVVTETIRSEIYVPANTSCTGIAVFVGSASAGNLTAYLIDSTGAQITGAVTASTAQSTTDAYQRIPWSGGAIVLKGPATYWVAIQGNNTGAKYNTHTIGNFGADKQTGTSYGTLTVAAAPTTFTTALGPVASLY